MTDYFEMPLVGTPHVVPCADLVEHNTNTEEGCICGPDQIPIERPDGSMGWYVLHHSLDGREAGE